MCSENCSLGCVSLAKIYLCLSVMFLSYAIFNLDTSFMPHENAFDVLFSFPQKCSVLTKENIKIPFEGRYYKFCHLEHRLDSTKGTYAKEWVKWEKQLREILSGNAEYLNSIQVNVCAFVIQHQGSIKLTAPSAVRLSNQMILIEKLHSYMIFFSQIITLQELVSH